nr:chromosome transmission fidelity protein 18 homolog [Leptinotarsa decemlineata]
MDDYPNPDEEFELMYGDELDILREQEDEYYQPPSKTRRSLDFSSTATEKQPPATNSQSVETFEKEFPTLSSLAHSSEISSVSNTEEIIQSLGTSSQIISSSSHNVEPSSSRKRTVEELFGDINDLGDDILLDDQPFIKKSKRSEEEELEALMEQIIELRRLNKEKNNIIGVRTNSATFNRQRDMNNISFRVPKYPFIGVKRFDGERVYVRFHSEEYEKEEIQRIVKECSTKSVMDDSSKQMWEDARALIEKQVVLASQETDRNDVMMVEGKTDDHQQLWTDLYKPRKYVELLSDESTNRIMLKWLKLWDKVVFNRKPKIHPIKPDDTKSKFNMEKELNRSLDEHGRPHHKVALLCGPPGLGKTTLAHVAAKHAGYNVVEINASDDRSTEAFKTSLKNATQMRSVVDSEGRPNCLVFDEIDGAPQASIDFLVKFINGTVSAKAKKGKGAKQFILKRPIICICNDVYVPALRPLRQIAFVINFPQTSSARLADRLMCIARRENIKTDLGAMLALAEKGNKDIRSCLSVLYFFKIQKKPVTLSDVYKSNIGQKDIQKGLFAVWQEIFRIEKPKLKSVTDLKSLDSKQITKDRMSKVLQTVSSFGDYDRLSQGVFENFPKLKLKDPSMNGVSEALNWFVFSDLLNKQIYSLQNYSLSSYLPYAFVVWNFVFATPQSQTLQYPSVGYEARQKEIRQKALISEVLRGMKPGVRAFCHRLSLILDILPLLSRIIVPSFRSVSLHLYSKEEKEKLLEVVKIMIDYNLNYIQERQAEGSYEYKLEPNIDEVVIFDKTNPHQRKTLSYPNKQLIAREIELEKMRQFEGPKNEGDSIKKKKEKPVDKNQLPNHLQKLQAKSVKPMNFLLRGTSRKAQRIVV